MPVPRLLLSSAGMLLTACALCAQERSMVLVADAEKRNGFLEETARAAFARVGYRVRVEYLPWPRALSQVMNGGPGALLGVYYTPERAKHMLYSEPIGTSELIFFRRRGTPFVFRRLADLDGRSVGTITGAAYTTDFDHAVSFRREPVADVATNIRKLLAGRIDLVIEKREVFLDTLRTRFPRQASTIEALPVPLTGIRFHLAISRSSPGAEACIADFNRGLGLLKAEGTARRIRERSPHE
nr:transporter substrate-binding domain-containing protein [uncultured Holophaga sp.]